MAVHERRFKSAALAVTVVCALGMACSDAETSNAGNPGTDASTEDAKGSGGAGGGEGGATDVESEPAAQHELRLGFERVKPGTEFRAIVTVLEAGVPRAGLDVRVTSPRGVVAKVSDRNDGTYDAMVSPDATGTGEYPVTATLSGSGVSVTRTAVVLQQVGERWGQPQAFGGMVNTPGWEDSLAISPDGEWLLLLYLPVTISCLLEHFDQPTHPLCAKARGPVGAPERPGLPGAERIAGDGTITHACPSAGLDPAPFPVPPSGLFGFRRRADGTFGEPFVIGVEGLDGCVNAWGPSVQKPVGSSARIVFALDDPSDGDPPAGTESDIYFHDFPLGAASTVARYSAGVFSADATRLGFPPAGHQGNPHFFEASTGEAQVWIDDETAAERDLFVYELGGSFPAGPWIGPTRLPPPLGEPGVEDTQPYFDGVEALWNRNLSIASSRYSGGAVTSAASWGPATTELEGGGAVGPAGTIVGVGEPTKAARDGREILAFVYVLRAPDGSLDINAGFVEEQP
jgi:hypothetical protein